MLALKIICELYRLRCQVELVSKRWKCHFDIDKVENVGEKYFECLIYGKLIVIALMTAMFSTVFAVMFREQRRLLSMLKFFKNLREKSEILLTSLHNVRGNAIKLYDAFVDVIGRSLDEKRKRKTTQQVLMEHNIPEIVLQMLA
jgi:hypothetical protein